MAKLSEAQKKMISGITPAAVATCTKDGKPNARFKGPLRLLDDEHIFYAESWDKQSLVNLRENPQLSAIVLDVTTRKMCQIWGKVEILESGELFDTISAEAASRGTTLKCVVKVAVEEIWSNLPP